MSEPPICSARLDAETAENALKALITDKFTSLHTTTLEPTEKLLAVLQLFDVVESWRTGDFSSGPPIYDPTTTQPNPAFNPSQPESPTNPRLLRQQFANNRKVPPPPFLDRTWIFTFDATREEGMSQVA